MLYKYLQLENPFFMLQTDINRSVNTFIINLPPMTKNSRPSETHSITQFYQAINGTTQQFNNQISLLLSRAVNSFLVQIQQIYQEIRLKYKRKRRSYVDYYGIWYPEIREDNLCKELPNENLPISRQTAEESILKLLVPNHTSQSKIKEKQKLYEEQYKLQKMEKNLQGDFDTFYNTNQDFEYFSMEKGQVSKKSRETRDKVIKKQMKKENIYLTEKRTTKRSQRHYGLTFDQEENLKDWIIERIRNNEDVTWTIIQSKALSISQQRLKQNKMSYPLSKNAENFKATRGWVSNFFIRNPEIRRAYHHYILRRKKQGRQFLIFKRNQLNRIQLEKMKDLDNQFQFGYHPHSENDENIYIDANMMSSKYPLQEKKIKSEEGEELEDEQMQYEQEEDEQEENENQPQQSEQNSQTFANNFYVQSSENQSQLQNQIKKSFKKKIKEEYSEENYSQKIKGKVNKLSSSRQ